MESGASLTLEDAKGRTPVDLLSGPVSQVVGKEPDLGIPPFLFSFLFGFSGQNLLLYLIVNLLLCLRIGFKNLRSCFSGGQISKLSFIV